MMIEVFLNMVDKTRENCIIPNFASPITYTCSLDLWMSCVSLDTFVIVVSFINASWEPCHVNLGFLKYTTLYVQP